MSLFTLRFATPADMAAITAIYAPYVAETTVSFETTPPGEAEMARRFTQRGDDFPTLVAEVDGAVAGYASAGRMAPRPGYDWAAECSIYVARERLRGGMGRALYGALLPLLAAQGYCEAYAIIASPNPESEAFHEKLGFVREGLLRRAGRKFGRVVSVAYYAKTLHEDGGDPPRPRPLSSLPTGQAEEILHNAAQEKGLP